MCVNQGFTVLLKFPVFVQVFLELSCTETVKYFIIFSCYSEHKICRKIVTILYSRFPNNVPGLTVNCILTVKVFVCYYANVMVVCLGRVKLCCINIFLFLTKNWLKFSTLPPQFS